MPTPRTPWGVDRPEGRSSVSALLAANWDGTPIRVIALDDLIANKRAAGRAQDLADVVKLERVRERQRDR
jgi:hypothetical protein